jgi:hypothetical protein
MCESGDLASQPVWQPAIYCARWTSPGPSFSPTCGGDVPAGSAHPKAPSASGRAYLRIAAEALDCPSEAVWRAISETQGSACDTVWRSPQLRRRPGRSWLCPSRRRPSLSAPSTSNPSFWPPRAPPKPPIRPRRCARHRLTRRDGAKTPRPARRATRETTQCWTKAPNALRRPAGSLRRPDPRDREPLHLLLHPPARDSGRDGFLLHGHARRGHGPRGRIRLRQVHRGARRDAGSRRQRARRGRLDQVQGP